MKKKDRPNLHVYRGWLVLRSNGEESDILAIASDVFRSSEDTILADDLSHNIFLAGQFLTVRYYLSNIEIPEDQLTAILVQTLYGHIDAKYGMRYSEITGYLWTDEKLQIGGHDLLKELKSNIGRFIHLEIEFNKEAKEKVN